MDEKIAWANKLRTELTNAANYIGENEDNLANVELANIEKYTNLITRMLWEHEERKTILPPHKRNDNET